MPAPLSVPCALLCCALALGCSSADEEASPHGSSSSVQGKNPTPLPVAPPPVLAPAAEPNPLGLPARKLELETGTRVFAVPEPMLRGARLGSAFSLRASTIAGRDGDNLVIDGRDGPDYSIHPGYVVPLVPAKRPRLNQPVIAEWAGGLRHGVVRRYVKDKIVVRFTDAQDRSDRSLGPLQMMPQVDGFRPGNYAARRVGSELQHVLLVSPLGNQKDATEWLALGYAGAARVVKTEELLGVPVSYEPKPGSIALVEHLGRMREGVVKEVDKPGLMTVRFERAGRPVETGWGLVMPPVVATK